MIKLCIENHNLLIPHECIDWIEKIGRKWYPFRVKDTFQKYPFLPKILFLTLLTCHTRYTPSCEKVPFSHIFLVMHMYTFIFEYYHPPPPRALKHIFSLIWYSLSMTFRKPDLFCLFLPFSNFTLIFHFKL